MSNCISIRREDVEFTVAEMNIKAFVDMIEKHKDCRSDKLNNTVACGVHTDKSDLDPKPYGTWEFHGEEDLKCYYVYWFLSTRNVYVNGSTLSPERVSIVIRFGHGESGHTWRDFKGTCNLINKFMLKEKTHSFSIEDEGFPGRGPYNVTFKPVPVAVLPNPQVA